jgi:importin subunit beta-1
MTEAEFIDILQNAYNNPDGKVRSHNEGLLMQFMETAADNFVSCCTSGFQNRSLQIPLRVAILTVLRSALKPKAHNAQGSIWPRLQFGSKETIKTAVINCLIDQNELIKKAAANLTAMVFVLDVKTDKTWFSLLDNLANNIDNQDLEIKKAAIMTLGYICELLNQEKITDLPKPQIESLIAGIIIGLKEYSEITNTAILALSNSIQYLRVNIQSPGFLEMIFEILVKLLVKSCESREEEIIRNTLLCLGEIVKMTFQDFERFSSITMQKVYDCYQITEPSIFLATNEFFMKLCRAEKAFGTKYFENFWQKLLGAAIEILMLRTAQDEGEVETGIIDSCSMLISSINELYPRVSFEMLIGFVHQNIDSQTESQKITSLVVFEAILEHSEENLAYAPINNGFFGMLSYLTQGTPRVKEYTMKLLIKIAQFHPTVFLNDQNFTRAMNDFNKYLDPSRREDAHLIKMRLGVLHCLRLLAESGPHIQSGSMKLTPYIDGFFDSMFNIIQRSTDKHLVDMMFTTMFDILEFSVEPRNLNEFFLGFAQFLNLINTSYTGPDPSSKKLIIESIFVDLNVILTRMYISQIDLVVRNSSTEQYLGQLFQFILDIFENYHEIMSEGLILCATILCYRDEFFASHVTAFNSKYTFEALKDVQNTELFKAGLEAVNMISKKFKGEFERQASDLFGYLVDKLQSTNLMKELKINIFHTIADMSLGFSKDLLPYFDKVLALVGYAVAAVAHFMNSDDIESQNYAEQLKECLIECYLCFTHAIYLKTSSKDREFETAFQELGSFLQFTCRRESNPSVHYLCTCLGLVLDVWTKTKNPNLVDINFIKSIMEALSHYQRHPDVPQALMYGNSMMANLNQVYMVNR